MTLTTADIIITVIALAGLVIGIISFMRHNPQATPAALDAEVARRVADLQADRPAIDRLETAYLTTGDMQRHALDTLADVLKTIAPYTGLKFDDALAKLLDDVQKAGAPAQGDTNIVPTGTVSRAAVEQALDEALRPDNLSGHGR